jgi:hypothetical protein
MLHVTSRTSCAAAALPCAQPLLPAAAEELPFALATALGRTSTRVVVVLLLSPAVLLPLLLR